MKLVGGMTLRKLASLPQSAYLQPHLEEFDKELQASASKNRPADTLASLKILILMILPVSSLQSLPLAVPVVFFIQKQNRNPTKWLRF